MKVTDEMVNRFLCWTLPPTFAPDGGVKFSPPGPDARGYVASWPSGTNLFTYEQARAMLEHVLATTPEH